jgi:hypothetical protein
MEAGVLLVSVKLIVMAYKNSVAAKDLSKELRDIKDILQKREEQRDQRDGS